MGQPVEIWIGTWPIEPGQSVWVECEIIHADGTTASHRVDAAWHHNAEPNSYWLARLEGCNDGDVVTYTVRGESPAGTVNGPTAMFRVAPRIHLALLWHQHQPLYLDRRGRREVYRFPWVRLHAIRDYYPMAALVAQYPQVHLTINLVPSLLFQLEGYVHRGARDRALELTRKPAARLADAEREEVCATFFDADWHNQIYPHPRYKALFERRAAGRAFSTQDLTDLQMWFNLAWFAPEFLDGEVALHDGSRFNLAPLVERGHGFTRGEIDAMVEAQYAVMRNVVLLHRALQEGGQIEVSTTPFYHPILPLIHDTNTATLDRPGAHLPDRFQAPDDAEAQVNRAAAFCAERFGVRPHGMWPAEGAVGQSIVGHFARAGVRWIASDQGVLERSGRWGYRTDDPNVLCQPYRAEDGECAISVFFRDRGLSDSIGFKYQTFADQEQAAAEFLAEIKSRLVDRVGDTANRVVTVVLDGENAWGAYRQAARPFFHALYWALSDDPDINTVTFSEFLDGNPARGVAAHPVASQPKVYNLFHGSWIDEWGSAPGVDLGTWIGDDEENKAWDLLRRCREALIAVAATRETHPEAFEALYAAEGSDWFWWFGADQDSGYDAVFDDLFRGHLRRVYRAIGRKPPHGLAKHIVPHTLVWTFASPIRSIQPRDRLTVRTNCAGILRWSSDAWAHVEERPLTRSGGVMAGLHNYAVTLGPFSEQSEAVEFVFQCTECDCRSGSLCCRGDRQRVLIAASRPGVSSPRPSRAAGRRAKR